MENGSMLYSGALCHSHLVLPVSQATLLYVLCHILCMCVCLPCTPTLAQRQPLCLCKPLIITLCGLQEWCGYYHLYITPVTQDPHKVGDIPL